VRIDTITYVDTLSDKIGILREIAGHDLSSVRGLAVIIFGLVASILIAATTLAMPWDRALLIVATVPAPAALFWSIYRWRVRRIPTFRQGEIGILVSFNWSGPASDRRWVEATLDALRDQIVQRASRLGHEGGREVKFVVRSLHRSRRVDDTNARRIVETSQASFLTWAAVMAGSKGLRIPVIKSGVRHRKLDAEGAAHFKDAISGSWTGRRDRIDVTTDLDDINYVAAHVATVAAYQLGLAALFRGTTEIAEGLLEEVTTAEGVSARLARRAKGYLAEIVILPWLQPGTIVPGASRPMIDAALEGTNRSLGYDGSCIPALALRVCALYLRGEGSAAKNANRSLRQHAPGMAALNSAVFALDGYRYDEALQSYKNARKKMGNSIGEQEFARVWLEHAVAEFGAVFELGLAFLIDHSEQQQDAAPHYEAARDVIPPGSKAASFVEGRIIELRRAAETGGGFAVEAETTMTLPVVGRGMDRRSL
jgi:hypothetical protein